MNIINVFNGLNAGIRAVTAAADVVVDASDLVIWLDRDGDELVKGLKAVSAVSRTAICALAIIDIIRLASGGFSTQGTLGFKVTELVVRSIDLPVQFTKTVVDSEGLTSAERILRVFEKGIVGPLAGLLRTATEISQQQEKRYLEMYEKDPNAMRPIYGYDKEGNSTIVGYKPINPEECRHVIESPNVAIIGAVEGIAELSPLEKIYHAVVMRRILNRQNNQPLLQNRPSVAVRHVLRPQNNQPLLQNRPLDYPGIDQNNQPSSQNLQSPEIVAQPSPDMVNIDQLFNFRALQTIPEEFHQDAVFQRYICPITQSPIRFLVQDPTARPARVFYERDAIAAWLVNRTTSPHTRKPLSEDQLIARPDLQQMIDERLEFHSRAIRELIQARLNQEVPPLEDK